ncbi:MAG: glycosyltransferase family 2 protein [Methylococcales bacterium]|nr:glycosyltransferase family 2 protein [Methylococcales bacterium]
MRTLSVFLFFSILCSLAFYSVVNLQQMLLTFQSDFLKVGALLIMAFTVIIIARYLLLLFFSMLKTIKITSKPVKRSNELFKVSIIVPAYNEELVIVKSIQSLMQQNYPFIEIIVVDDGSSDQTYKLAKKLEFNQGNKSLVVLTKPNGGKAIALNYGIKKSTGDLVMVVDSDSKLSDGAVELMVSHFNDEKIGAVAGSVFISNRVNLLTKLQALEYIEGLNMVRNGQAFFQLVSIIPGPIGMFRKSALQKVGGYESDTFAEDADLTMNLIGNGYKVEFESEAVAYTEAPEELLDLIKQRYRWTRGILQSLGKHKAKLLHVFKTPSISLILWYMLFEAIFWPIFDVFGTLFCLYIAFIYGESSLLFYWWMLFTVMDVAGALYCLMMTGESLYLSFYAILYRLYFISIINVSKIFATIEEWTNTEMEWGKLDRKGRL